MKRIISKLNSETGLVCLLAICLLLDGGIFLIYGSDSKTHPFFVKVVFGVFTGIAIISGIILFFKSIEQDQTD
jgi:hypothetical protein